MTNPFVKVKCQCHNEQVIFSRASSVVKCLICGEVLAEPKGGRAELKAPVLQVFE